MSQGTAIDQTDWSMLRVMGLVLGALVLFTLFCVTMARMLGLGAYDENDRIVRTALLERIAPVGSVRTEPLPEQTADAGDAGGEGEQVAMRSGEELYGGACSACHQQGVGGAPAIDNDEEWAKRREAGLDNLVASVVNGKGAMPAGGGSDYSEEEIERAVTYLAGFEGEAATGEDAGGSEAGGMDSAAQAQESGDASGGGENAGDGAEPASGGSKAGDMSKAEGEGADAQQAQ